jgi:hypothetical protein
MHHAGDCGALRTVSPKVEDFVASDRCELRWPGVCNLNSHSDRIGVANRNDSLPITFRRKRTIQAPKSVPVVRMHGPLPSVRLRGSLDSHRSPANPPRNTAPYEL